MSQERKRESPPTSLFGSEIMSEGDSMFGSDKDDDVVEIKSEIFSTSQESAVSETLRIDGRYLIPNYPASARASTHQDQRPHQRNLHDHSLFVSDNNHGSADSSSDHTDWGFCNDISTTLALYPDTRSPGTQPRQGRDNFTLKETKKASSNESRISITIPTGSLLHPRSVFEPFLPAKPIRSEEDVLKVFAFSAEAGSDRWTEYILNNFTVYCDVKDKYPNEMRSLHLVGTANKTMQLYCDGFLSYKEQEFYLQKVPIRTLPIGNYLDSSIHSVDGQIWIETELSEKQKACYRLSQPSWEYERFFKPFVWVVDLTKHVVDFMNFKKRYKQSVSIHHFRSEFSKCLHKEHGTASDFIAWRQQYPRDDFRVAITSNIAFIYKECFGTLGEKSVKNQTLWSEVLNLDKYESIPSTDKQNRTVVTKYIYDCFSHMPFGDQLKVQQLNLHVAALHTKVASDLSMEVSHDSHARPKDVTEDQSASRAANIKAGDTISTARDEGTDTLWKKEESLGSVDTDRWFARVEKVHRSKKGERSFDVIWYYRPVDTLCALMKYPWNNELFFSTHCSCDEENKIKESQILGVHEVEFWGDSNTSKEFFCRQTYVHEERKWVILNPVHLDCSHKQERNQRLRNILPSEFEPGDTLLVQLSDGSKQCEPCEVLDITEDDHREIHLRVRRFVRRYDRPGASKTSAANEVLYTGIINDVPESQVIGRCGVVFVKQGDAIPTPFDHNGAGCLFYFTHRLVDGVVGEQLMPMDVAPPSLKQFQTVSDYGLPKLRGLDLFCGGGNFGRGLEDGDGVEMRWINDYDSKAIHTYMANSQNADEVTPFLGSIDEFNKQAMEQMGSQSVPKIGDVDFIARGSPCPGFSVLTNDTTTSKQRKNQSLVAAFASCVDVYRPKFGVLENVATMIRTKDSRNEDVFSQLMCALVGMGYQTRLFLLDACACGASQIRSRIFIVFSAPGYVLPEKPRQSHAYPAGTRMLRVGRLITGEAMAERDVVTVFPFEPNTAERLTADLPALGDAKPDICIPFPDHRCPVGRTQALADQFALIPRRPLGLNLAKVYHGTASSPGLLSEADKAVFVGGSKSKWHISKKSNAFGRILPDRLFPTITTTAVPRDVKTGRIMNWDDDRTVTVFEAKRAQGFRDEDVLLGEPANQYKIVSNSVARGPAVAIGICIQEAYIKSHLIKQARGRATRADRASGADKASGSSTVTGLNQSSVRPDASHPRPSTKRKRRTRKE